jgi:hypothetical protein
MILLISASHVVRITGVSHGCLAMGVADFILFIYLFIYSLIGGPGV